MKKLMAFLLTVTFALAPVLSFGAGNMNNDSFSKAKKMLKQYVYADHQISFYCGAQYNNYRDVILPQGFSTPSFQNRAERIEWEHAVPAENFGRAFREWRYGDPQCVDNRGRAFRGRKCAEKVNMQYRYMQADMYNLFPAIGAVNAVRSNRQYSALPDSDGPLFGTCGAKMSGNRFEPPDRAKGQAARASLYMQASYPQYRISSQQKQLFEAWDRMYPVDSWECERAARIERLQGNANDFVKKRCLEAGFTR